MTGTKYISETALKEAIEKASHTKFDWSEEIDRDDLFKVIDEIPAEDVAEVKRGEWVYGEYDTPHCSECGHEPKEISPFCPICGANMEED